MEVLAILGGVIGILFTAMAFYERQRREAKIWFIIAILSQVFWFPQFLPEQITIENRITNKHNSMEFECPVKITTIEKQKPFSIDTTTEYKVEFIKEN